MPEYEFFCRRCGKPFTVHMSVKQHDTNHTACPECRKADEVEKRLGVVSVVTSRKS